MLYPVSLLCTFHLISHRLFIPLLIVARFLWDKSTSIFTLQTNNMVFETQWLFWKYWLMQIFDESIIFLQRYFTVLLHLTVVVFKNVINLNESFELFWSESQIRHPALRISCLNFPLASRKVILQLVVSFHQFYDCLRYNSQAWINFCGLSQVFNDFIYELVPSLAHFLPDDCYLV